MKICFIIVNTRVNMISFQLHPLKSLRFLCYCCCLFPVYIFNLTLKANKTDLANEIMTSKEISVSNGFDPTLINNIIKNEH